MEPPDPERNRLALESILREARAELESHPDRVSRILARAEPLAGRHPMTVTQVQRQARSMDAVCGYMESSE